jgi:choline monooxygenase
MEERIDMKKDRTNGIDEVIEALAEIRDLDESQARSLPAGFYASEAYLELEKEEIFRKEWVCLGRIDEISNQGDYYTTQLLDEPLIVARGEDNKVRILSNVCRHRSSLSSRAMATRSTSYAPTTPGPMPTTASFCALLIWIR